MEQFGLPKESQNPNGFGVTVQFQVSHRFSQKKGVGLFAKSVLEGTLTTDELKTNFSTPISQTRDEKGELEEGLQWVQGTKDKYEPLLNQKVKNYKKFINAETIEESLSLLHNVRVLCSNKTSEVGVLELNRYIEKYLFTVINDPSRFNPQDGFYQKKQSW